MPGSLACDVDRQLNALPWIAEEGKLKKMMHGESKTPDDVLQQILNLPALSKVGSNTPIVPAAFDVDFEPISVLMWCRLLARRASRPSPRSSARRARRSRPSTAARSPSTVRDSLERSNPTRLTNFLLFLRASSCARGADGVHRAHEPHQQRVPAGAARPARGCVGRSIRNAAR